MSIQSQFREFTAHHDTYASIDPKAALKGSAEGKVVFIAGASRGIGQATAVAFAHAGAAAIYVTARSKSALQETCDLIATANPETKCGSFACDVTNANQVKDAVANCVAEFGGIDIADANAGFLGPWVKIGETDPATWWKNWEVNVQGAYHIIRYTLPHLIESARKRADQGQNGGHLVLMSSISAQLLMPGASDYQTSKHAINRLCEFVQSDHNEDGIKCFAVHPGGVATELGQQMPETMHEYLVDSPELAASFIVWLTSGQADWAKGRYMSANWDVDEVLSIRDEIVENDLFVNRLRA